MKTPRLQALGCARQAPHDIASRTLAQRSNDYLEASMKECDNGITLGIIDR